MFLVDQRKNCARQESCQVPAFVSWIRSGMLFIVDVKSKDSELSPRSSLLSETIAMQLNLSSENLLIPNLPRLYR